VKTNRAAMVGVTFLSPGLDDIPVVDEAADGVARPKVFGGTDAPSISRAL